MNRFLLLIVLLLHLPLIADYEDYKDEYQKLQTDSLTLEMIFWRLKSDYTRSKVQSMIDEVTLESKLFKSYNINFYYSKDYYGKDYQNLVERSLPIDAILDSLDGVINSSNILKLTTINIEDINNPEVNSNFYPLDQKPQYRDSDLLKKTLVENVQSNLRKTSFEWIWGKSIDNDAFFSSKLTLFDDIFTFYPVYRTYLGENSTQHKSAWFVELNPYNPNLLKDLYMEMTTEDEEPKPEIVADEIEPSEQLTINFETELNDTTTLFDNSEASLRIDTKSNQEKAHHFKPSLSGIVIKSIEYQKDSLGVYKKINSSKRDLTSILDHLVVDPFTGLMIDEDRIENYIPRGSWNGFRVVSRSNHFNSILDMMKTELSEPSKRYSYMFITHRDKNRYYFNLLTFYDNIATIFYGYEKRVSRKLRKDPSSWFNSIPLK